MTSRRSRCVRWRCRTTAQHVSLCRSSPTDRRSECGITVGSIESPHRICRWPNRTRRPSRRRWIRPAHTDRKDDEQTRTRMTQVLTGALTGVGLGQSRRPPWGATGEVLSMNPIPQTVSAAAPLSGELARRHRPVGPDGSRGTDGHAGPVRRGPPRRSACAGRSWAAAADRQPGRRRHPPAVHAQGVGEAVTEGGRATSSAGVCGKSRKTRTMR